MLKELIAKKQAEKESEKASEADPSILPQESIKKKLTLRLKDITKTTSKGPEDFSESDVVDFQQDI